MQNVCIEATGNSIKLTTTDIDISINCEVECEVTEPGATTLPVKILANMVSCSAEGVIDVDVGEGGRASIRAGSTKFRLVGIDAKEFPSLPKNDDAYAYSLKQSSLKEMFRKTAYAASQDETRRTLRGVMLAFKNGRITMVATDGRRLALVEKDPEFPGSDWLSQKPRLETAPLPVRPGPFSAQADVETVAREYNFPSARARAGN